MGYSKSGLAIAISKLEVFSSPNPKLEQYPTDSEVAAEVLWQAKMLGDIEGKTIADLGCGTGILGIGALLLGAKNVFFVDTDTAALAALGNNLKMLGIGKGYGIENSSVEKFNRDVEVVIENPPFGTREKHIDRLFLGRAMLIAETIYTFHKTATSGFVESFSRDSGFRITNRWDFSFPLKGTMDFHKKRIQRIQVSCFRLAKV